MRTVRTYVYNSVLNQYEIANYVNGFSHIIMYVCMYVRMYVCGLDKLINTTKIKKNYFLLYLVSLLPLLIFGFLAALKTGNDDNLEP